MHSHPVKRSFTEKFESSIVASLYNNMFGCNVGSVVGVALSGGADSVALVSALARQGISCVALHCNFSLRGEESDGDEAFCRELCSALGVRLESVRFNTVEARQSGESIEMACRRLRYEWFEIVAEQLGIDVVALAHHFEDVQETMLLNLLRGTGPRGLCGIRSRRGIFVRPMLELSREMIESYLREIGVGFRVDSSNQSNTFRRNALRNLIIPEIKKYFPDFDAGMSATIRSMQSAVRLIDGCVDRIAAECVSGSDVDVARLSAYVADAAPMLYELLRRVYPGGCSMETVESILKVSCCESARFATVNGDELELSRGVLRKLPPQDERCWRVSLYESILQPIPIGVSVISATEFHSGERGRDVAYFDASLLGGERVFALRHWRHGDRMKPFGMKGSVKLSDLFTDVKYSEAQKRMTWVLTVDDEILWVVGLRASRRYAVTDSTTSVVKLKLDVD